MRLAAALLYGVGTPPLALRARSWLLGVRGVPWTMFRPAGPCRLAWEPSWEGSRELAWDVPEVPKRSVVVGRWCVCR